MTTASSLPFSTMEVPATEDTMEMASPLPGNADDFEIDLDVMEDQASNADKDMMGADGYPDGSLDIDLNHDGANDADMMDEPAEPTMVDADDQNDNNVEMQYSAETYEAEMEDGYDEDIDVLMPKPDDEVPTVVEDGNAQPVDVEVAVEEPAQTKDIPEKDAENPSLESHVEAEKEQVAENIEVPHTETAQNDHPGAVNAAHQAGPDQVQLHDTNKVEPAELQDVQPDVSENDHTDQKEPDDKDHETAQAQPPAEEAKDQEAEPAAKPESVESAEQEARPDTDEHAGLHPVKVYYQDNEISLFPPREGDSSETFFLEDEGLAYESLGKLFESCHEVLRDHIGDNEVLVVDIDALNIQLTEDSLHLSKVTLRQIVNLYLRLCQNDNIEEPEALYLTLSTKLTIPAAVSDLLAAAEEGKGLSEIYSWDDYEEAGPPSEEAHADDQYDYEPHEEGHAGPEEHQDPVVHEVPKVPEENEDAASEREAPVPAGPVEFADPAVAEEPHGVGEQAPEISQHETAKHEDNLHHDPQQETSDQNELDAHEQDVHDEQDDRENEHDDISNDRGEGHVPTAEVEQDEYEERQYEEGEYDFDGQEYNESKEHDHHSPNEYDSEEQKTESTATITALPGTNLEDEQQYTGQPADAPHIEDGDQDGYQGTDGIGEEDYPEEETNVDAPNHVEYPEQFEDNGGDDVYDEAKAEESAEESRDEDPSAVHELDHRDGNTAGLASKEEVADEALQGDSEDISHDQPEDGAPELTQGEHRGTSGNVDDLGLEDDLTEGTLKNATDVNGETGREDQDHASSGEVLDETEHALSTNPQEGTVEDLPFDGGDEYLHLDFDVESGQPESVANSHVSTKRSREAEDDFELVETPTPDVKRTRSS